MNRERLNWGLLLLFVGVMWLLSNIGIIHFYWISLWHFWPVFLIILGVNLLLPRNEIGNVISVLATVIALVFIGFQASTPSRLPISFPGIVYHDRADEDNGTDWDESGEVKHQDFSANYQEEIKRANLDIRGGAIEYKIEGNTQELFHAETKGTFVGHVLNTTVKDSVADLAFTMKKQQEKKLHFGKEGNEAIIRLHPDPIWHIRTEVGAGAVEYDLERYKVQELTFKGGAASFRAKLGPALTESVISVDSGVASIEIEIPKSTAAKILVDSGLSSKEFSGFTKRDDGSYETDGYAQSRNRYLIHLKGGLSSFSVSRY